MHHLISSGRLRLLAAKLLRSSRPVNSTAEGCRGAISDGRPFDPIDCAIPDRQGLQARLICDVHCGGQIRMVAGFAEVIESEETLIAAACNHPNCLVLPFRLELIRLAA
jgi:hypothetical protein